MTGFGKASGTHGNKKISVEIRSLNSKQLDLNTRMPSHIKEKEIEMRNMIASNAERGKIDLSIFYESIGEEKVFTINKEVAKGYFRDMELLAAELDIPFKESALSNLMRLPEILNAERKELDEEEWTVLKQLISEALDHFNKFREDEGSRLQQELTERTQSIMSLLEKVSPFEKERIEIVKERLRKSLEENVGKENVDKNRFEQELIFYLEKLDVSEEKMRLATHCRYFEETMIKENSQGRKLGFITQEIGREINTLGSKSNHAEMQKIVVLMKDELEKIKEQVLNVL